MCVTYRLSYKLGTKNVNSHVLGQPLHRAIIILMFNGNINLPFIIRKIFWRIITPQPLICSCLDFKQSFLTWGNFFLLYYRSWCTESLCINQNQVIKYVYIVSWHFVLQINTSIPHRRMSSGNVYDWRTIVCCSHQKHQQLRWQVLTVPNLKTINGVSLKTDVG